MKALEALVPKYQNKNYRLKPEVRKFLVSKSRKVLLSIFRLSRDRSRRKGAYFWRAVKQESWRLLAKVPLSTTIYYKDKNRHRIQVRFKDED